MCQHISLKVVRQDDDVKVYSLLNEDSHTAIHKKRNIRDNDLENQVSVEVVPVNDLTDCSNWELIFDTPKPKWWNELCEAKVRKEVKKLHSKYWNAKTKTYTFKGDLTLDNLKSIPKGVTIKSGGKINLSGLTYIGERVTLNASNGRLELDNLRSLPEGVTLKSSQRIAANFLTSISKGVTIESNRAIFINSLTSIAKGVTLKAKHIHFSQFTSIPKGVKVKALYVYIKGDLLLL